MCVIVSVLKQRPSPEMIEKMWERNDHGAGVAWRKDGAVEWRKGLDLKEVKELCQTLPLPFIVHFRLNTVGGKVPALCHPFPVDPAASLALEGRTTGSVLFHNGTYSGWRSQVLIAARDYKVPVPAGRWSDTRAIAFLTSLYGPGFPEIELGEDRAVVFGVNDIEYIEGDGGVGKHWVEVEGIWCSNDRFMTSKEAPLHVPGIFHQWCRVVSCCNRELNARGYCKEHEELDPHHKPQTVSMVVSTPASDGAGYSGPFSDIAAAEQAYREGKLSRNKLRAARKHFEAQVRAVNQKARDAQTIAP